MSKIVKQGATFGSIGALTTAIHLLAALTINKGLGVPPLQANGIAFCLAWFVSYFGNFVFTFNRGSKHRESVPRFAVVSLLGFAINQTIIWLTVDVFGMAFVFGLAIVLVIVPVTSFVLARCWAFKPVAT